MWKYILKRCLWLIVVIIATAFVIFTILYLTPRDPARALMGGLASASEVESMRTTLGLDQPYLTQLGQYFYNTFIKFDFGESWVYNVPVYQELLVRLPRTLIIGLVSMVVSVAISLILGVFAGTHPGRWQDYTTMGVTMMLISCPDFWLALMMIVLFSAKLKILPAYGIDDWKCYIMPIICSALPGIAVNARQTRSSILEVLRMDYITTARSKGQTEHNVVYRHMLPNALMPIVTHLGGHLSRIVAGSAIIESVFSIPGVGMYMLTAINKLDYPVIRACVLFFAVFAAVIMLIVDLVYAFIDPRIKAQYAGKGGK